MPLGHRSPMDPAKEFLSAVQARDAPRARALLDADPDLARARGPDGTSELLLACYAGAEEVAETLLARGARLDVLEAAALGRVERVRDLVKADPALLAARSPERWTPLHLATQFGWRDVAALLVQQGADPDEAGAGGYTALHLAAGIGRVDLVELLLGRGASVKAEADDGRTPLAVAVEQRHAPVVQLLRSRGAPA